MDEQHPEDDIFREGSDRLPRVERTDLKPDFQEEAVAGCLPGVQAYPLILGVSAFEHERRIVVSPTCKPRENSRLPDPSPYLFLSEPAEEEVIRVVPRKVEEELLLG